jgi:NAD dependent epimerase/dehydratase family enzyme
VRARPDRLTALGFRFRHPALEPALADLLAP